MRIVDQHKIYSVEFDDVVVVRNEDVIMAESMYKDASYRLGTYEDEKRAIDVLNEIHKAHGISICNTLRVNDDSSLDDISQFIGMNEIVKAENTFECLSPMICSENAVFYMPRQ